MRTIRTLSIAVVALLAAAPAGAAAQAPDAAPGMLVSGIAGAVKACGTPGAQVLVARDGGVVLDRGFGVRSLAGNEPVNRDTRFEIGSITKQFTAAAILQLLEQHKLSLDDSLGKFESGYPAAAHVTLRQLLWQVSGIPNYTAVKGFRSYSAAHPGGIAAVLGLIRDKPLEFAPGTTWMYSNTNYALLGHVVAVASGMSWQRYIRTHIFVPAGMTHSTFNEDESRVSDLARGYAKQSGKLAASPPMGHWALGAGSIVSTVGDLAKWDDAFFGGRIVSPAHVKLATTPGVLANGSPTDYGFGWVIDRHEGQPRIWHNGGTFGYLSINENFTGLAERIIVLVNDTGCNPSGVADAAFAALNPTIAAADTSAATGEDPAITKQAQQWWQALVNGTVDRSRMTPAMQRALTPIVLSASKKQFAALGAPVSWTFKGQEEISGATVYKYRVAFPHGTVLNVTMALAPDGKLAGYVARPN